MQHLDEGRIVELLDEGHMDDPAWDDAHAHLAECPECRAQLKKHRQIRDRAGVILAGSGPAEAPAPPFADVIARAGQPTARKPRQRTLRIVAWAATVAIAAGVGWYGRGALFDQAQPETASRTNLRTAPAPVEEDAPAGNLPAEGAIAVRAATEPAATEPPATAPVPAPVRALTGRALGAERERTDAGARGRGEAADEEAQQPEVVPARPNVRLREAPAEAVTEEVHVPFDDRPKAERDRDGAWRVVDLQEAEQLLGGSVARIEGLATLGHAVRLERDGYAVRTRQRVGEIEVELVQRSRAAVSAAAVEQRQRPAPSAVARDSVAGQMVARSTAPIAEATVTTSGFAITGRAPIPLDSLRALLARLRF